MQSISDDDQPCACEIDINELYQLLTCSLKISKEIVFELCPGRTRAMSIDQTKGNSIIVYRDSSFEGEMVEDTDDDDRILDEMIIKTKKSKKANCFDIDDDEEESKPIANAEDEYLDELEEEMQELMHSRAVNTKSVKKAELESGQVRIRYRSEHANGQNFRN